MITVHLATSSEIEWINERYAEVDFCPSCFDQEIIAIAEYTGEKAGLARLIKIDEDNFEMGGMVVFKAFQGKGIPQKIVEFLIKQIHPSQKIYSIPYRRLLPLYKKMGSFILCEDLTQVPKKVVEKYHWCQKKYPQPTCLIELEKGR